MSEEEKRSQRQRLTDEELFYDPHMDEEDEQWVKRQRMAYHNGQYPCTTTVSTPDHNSQYVYTSNLWSFLHLSRSNLSFSPLLLCFMWCCGVSLPSPQILFAQDITSHLSETFRNILIQIPKFYIAWCAVLTSRDSGHDVCNHSSQPVYSHSLYIYIYI